MLKNFIKIDFASGKPQQALETRLVMLLLRVTSKQTLHRHPEQHFNARAFTKYLMDALDGII